MSENENWSVHFDEVHQAHYYYNEKTGHSQWDAPDTALNSKNEECYDYKVSKTRRKKVAMPSHMLSDKTAFKYYSDMEEDDDDNDDEQNFKRSLHRFDVSSSSRNDDYEQADLDDISQWVAFEERNMATYAGYHNRRTVTTPASVAGVRGKKVESSYFINERALNKDYLALAATYRIQRPYMDKYRELTCVLCHGKKSLDVFFPCEHRCVCPECIVLEDIVEDSKFNLRDGEGHCNCPLCGEIIKKILPHQYGDEVEQYWKWVLEVPPPIPKGFQKRFRLVAGALETVYCNAEGGDQNTNSSVFERRYHLMVAVSELLLVLRDLIAADNATRSSAEAVYSNYPLTELLPSLLAVVNDQSNILMDIKKLSVVLLRRALIQDKKVYNEMDSSMQKTLQIGLLESLAKQEDSGLKLTMCNLVGEFADLCLSDNGWPEALQLSHSLIQSDNSIDKMIGFNMFSSLISSAISSGLIDMTSTASLLGIKSIFEVHLVYIGDGEGKVMLAALKALSSLLECQSRPSDIDNVVDLVKPVFEGLFLTVDHYLAAATTIANNDQKIIAISYLETLIEIVDVKVDFFTTDLNYIFEAIMTILENRFDVQSKKALYHMLIEFLVELCTASPTRVRKLRSRRTGEKGEFPMRFLPFCLKMMSAFCDDPGWEMATTSGEYTTTAESNEDSDVGEAAFARVVVALGLSSTLHIVVPQLVPFFQSPEWQYQHAGLKALASYLEVTATISVKSDLRKHREEVVVTLVTFAQAAKHPRVRCAAFSAMVEFFLHHGTGLKEAQVSSLLPVILTGIDIAQNPAVRVREQALSSLVYLIDTAPSELLEDSVYSILQVVTVALNQGPLMIQEVCVSAIVSVAESLNRSSQLAVLYDDMMPILKKLLTHARAVGEETLWGKVMECCARYGEAAGKTKFYDDALQMMAALMLMTDEQLEASPDTRKILMKAWVRIARCLEADFYPYLPVVMKCLLAAVTQDLSAGTGDIDLDDLEDRSDVEMVETEDGWVAMRTSAIEEQVCGCELLLQLAEKLETQFYVYVHECVGAVTPLLKSPHSDIRSLCMACMSQFIRVVGVGAPDSASYDLEVASASDFVLNHLVEAAKAEADSVEMIISELQLLVVSVRYACTDWRRMRAVSSLSGPDEKTAYLPLLTEAQMLSLTDCARTVLRDSLQRRAVMRAQQQLASSGDAAPDEADIDDSRQFMAESLELHFAVAELVGAIFKMQGPAYFSCYMALLHEVVLGMSHEYCLKEDRQIAFYIICDVIESGLNVVDEQMAFAYFQQTLPPLCATCAATDEAFWSLKQAAAYSLGVAARVHPPMFAAFAVQALQALGQCIATGEDSGEGDHETVQNTPPSLRRGPATDNAVASVGVILEKMEALEGQASIPYRDLWGQWLEYLPLRHDAEEGLNVLKQLVRIVFSTPAQLSYAPSKSRSSLIVNDARLARVFYVLLVAYESTSLSSAALDVEIRGALSSFCEWQGGAGLGKAQMVALLGEVTVSAEERNKLIERLDVIVTR